MTSLFRLVLILLLPALSGCVSMYFPTPPAAPLLTQKGEFNGMIGTNFSGNTSVQGAYAITDQLGVIGTAASLHSATSKKLVEHDFAELGLGRYSRLRDGRVLELYGGYGYGLTKRVELTPEGRTARTLDGSLNKLFVQANFSKKKTRTWFLFDHYFPVSYGVALRMSYVNLGSFRIDGMSRPSESNIFLEPITYARVQVLGPIQLQYISGNIIGLRRQEFLKAANSVMSLGIIVNLGGQEGRK
ncbi:hypothetical protein LJY25_14555 [Hymenobacter sp. BT175]|uniref:hypothetical protein n=1 Tax=Hymenobacter translucens TaxID=2886507 RepID=UPI001D0E62CB|nr:hypothetical protein [Hymenobacter translucens]MCC2547673.1 hypothetical protein [Hymenobacter translucens]